MTPDIPDVLQKVGKANYISCFYARCGYWQLPIKKNSQWLTAFVCDSGLTFNLNKCTFAQNKAIFVRHVINSGKIEPDPVKVAIVHDIKPPVTKKDVRRLIGFFSYFRSFIPSLAEKAKILTNLTQKHIPNKVPWSTKHQNAFDKLKADLCNCVVLNTIDFLQDFGLLINASAIAVGCCLIQWLKKTKKPIAFARIKLSETQSRWSTIEREAFAVIWALRKFRSWIFMSKVIISSDHNPLTFLTDTVLKSNKLTRWALTLQEFYFEFRYRAGRKNTAADFLSRL